MTQVDIQVPISFYSKVSARVYEHNWTSCIFSMYVMLESEDRNDSADFTMQSFKWKN